RNMRAGGRAFFCAGRRRNAPTKNNASSTVPGSVAIKRAIDMAQTSRSTTMLSTCVHSVVSADDLALVHFDRCHSEMVAKLADVACQRQPVAIVKSPPERQMHRQERSSSAGVEDRASEMAAPRKAFAT